MAGGAKEVLMRERVEGWGCVREVGRRERGGEGSGSEWEVGSYSF